MKKNILLLMISVLFFGCVYQPAQYINNIKVTMQRYNKETGKWEHIPVEESYLDPYINNK